MQTAAEDAAAIKAAGYAKACRAAEEAAVQKAAEEAAALKAARTAAALKAAEDAAHRQEAAALRKSSADTAQRRVAAEQAAQDKAEELAIVMRNQAALMKAADDAALDELEVLRKQLSIYSAPAAEETTIHSLYIEKSKNSVAERTSEEVLKVEVVTSPQKRSSVSHASHEIICGDLPETNEFVVKDGEEYTWATAQCVPDGGLQSAVVAVCTTPSLFLSRLSRTFSNCFCQAFAVLSLAH